MKRHGLPRVSCDSLVALGNATADGTTLFAKNSDRPADEPQPLVQMPRRRHAARERLRCQYIEIDQVGETARVIGSQPFWLWGFEHGLNEHGVAIGNHTVFARDGLEGHGLIGMDLVRLGLERGTSARNAIEVIASLVERYGQGGSGYIDKDWPYHNSFLVADAREAFLLETSDRHWALRHVDDVGSASNHVSIAEDWDSLAEGTIEHAIERGWWSEDSERHFDFAAAFRDSSLVPAVISSGRHRRTCALLENRKGRLTAADLRMALRDHYEGGVCFKPGRAPDDERAYSVCMHADPVGTTTASMIARLPADGTPATYWASLGSPCLGLFLPLYVTGEVPAELARGGEHASADSPWWRFKALLSRVEADWSLAPRVRGFWDEIEAGIEREREQVEERARELRQCGEPARAAAALNELSQQATASALRQLERLLAEL